MVRFKQKEYINTLLNVDSVFGEYEGRTMPIIITIVLAALPLLVWLFLLQGTIIRLWHVIVADVPWSIWWASIFIGKGREKMRFYEQQKHDEYKSADEIVHVQYIHDDGLIEYDNGKVGYLITCYSKGYITDDKLSVDMEAFMTELDMWNWDMYLHNTVDEILCEDELPNLKRYEDKQVIKERIDFYAYQDEWSRTHSGLYRITFLVTSAKYDWKKMRTHLTELCSSELALMFNECKLCGYDDVSELFDRDMCGFVNIEKMLMSKFDNEQYHGSRVLWYDEEIPQELVPEQDKSDMEQRRV